MYFYPFPVKPAHFPGCTCLSHARKEKVPCSHVEVRFCVVTALNLEKAPHPLGPSQTPSHLYLIRAPPPPHKSDFLCNFWKSGPCFGVLFWSPNDHLQFCPTCDRDLSTWRGTGSRLSLTSTLSLLIKPTLPCALYLGLCF